jgi:hypothetical protein
MFWKDKPINEEIPLVNLENINLDNHRFTYNHSKNYENLDVLLKFINTNYFYKNDKFRFVYRREHLEYFLKNGGWISMRSNKFPDTIIGVVAYRLVKLNDDSTTSEVDFLCVKECLRKTSIVTFIIDNVIKTIVETGVNTCFFTGMDKRNIPHYCVKRIFIYPLDLVKLMKLKYIPLCLMRKISYTYDHLVYSKCKDYSCIKDNYNALYIKEDLKKEECFIDYVVGGNFFRFMKIDVSTTSSVIKAVTLYYSTAPVYKYIDNLGYILKNEHKIDSIILYEKFPDNIKNNQNLFDTKSPIFYYSFNKRITNIEDNPVSMNPV